MSLRWSIAVLLVREMLLMPRGRKAFLLCQDSSRAASELPLLSAARILGRGITDVTFLIYLSCLHCLFGLSVVYILVVVSWQNVH